ncbi:NUDIX hydrolase [Marmoricola sp. RAF53]|uniref:NUDIX hydrolase n=1 Tax=Marmoricola sp. RAF53 TaxID=3233059 RepID=UPI003F963224
MAAQVEAAVLLPVYVDERGPVLVLTERSADLRKHAGEISFPGGRRDPGEDLVTTALREAEEEIGLSRELVEVVDELPSFGTYVSGFRITPFVGRIPAGQVWTPHVREVARVLELPVADLVAGHRYERLWAKGVPVRTDTYTVDGHLVWGATARILSEYLARQTGS